MSSTNSDPPPPYGSSPTPAPSSSLHQPRASRASRPPRTSENPRLQRSRSQIAPSIGPRQRPPQPLTPYPGQSSVSTAFALSANPPIDGPVPPETQPTPTMSVEASPQHPARPTMNSSQAERPSKAQLVQVGGLGSFVFDDRSEPPYAREDSETAGSASAFHERLPTCNGTSPCSRHGLHCPEKKSHKDPFQPSRDLPPSDPSLWATRLEAAIEQASDAPYDVALPFREAAAAALAESSPSFPTGGPQMDGPQSGHRSQSGNAEQPRASRESESPESVEDSSDRPLGDDRPAASRPEIRKHRHEDRHRRRSEEEPSPFREGSHDPCPPRNHRESRDNRASRNHRASGGHRDHRNAHGDHRTTRSNPHFDPRLHNPRASRRYPRTPHPRSPSPTGSAASSRTAAGSSATGSFSPTEEDGASEEEPLTSYQPPSRHTSQRKPAVRRQSPPDGEDDDRETDQESIFSTPSSGSSSSATATAPVSTPPSRRARRRKSLRRKRSRIPLLNVSSRSTPHTITKASASRCSRHPFECPPNSTKHSADTSEHADNHPVKVDITLSLKKSDLIHLVQSHHANESAEPGPTDQSHTKLHPRDHHYPLDDSDDHAESEVEDRSEVDDEAQTPPWAGPRYSRPTTPRRESFRSRSRSSRPVSRHSYYDPEMRERRRDERRAGRREEGYASQSLSRHSSRRSSRHRASRTSRPSNFRDQPIALKRPREMLRTDEYDRTIDPPQYDWASRYGRRLGRHTSRSRGRSRRRSLSRRGSFSSSTSSRRSSHRRGNETDDLPFGGEDDDDDDDAEEGGYEEDDIIYPTWPMEMTSKRRRPPPSERRRSTGRSIRSAGSSRRSASHRSTSHRGGASRRSAASHRSTSGRSAAGRSTSGRRAGKSLRMSSLSRWVRDRERDRARLPLQKRRTPLPPSSAEPNSHYIVAAGDRPMLETVLETALRREYLAPRPRSRGRVRRSVQEAMVEFRFEVPGVMQIMVLREEPNRYHIFHRGAGIMERFPRALDARERINVVQLLLGYVDEQGRAVSSTVDILRAEWESMFDFFYRLMRLRETEILSRHGGHFQYTLQI